MESFVLGTEVDIAPLEELAAIVNLSVVIGSPTNVNISKQQNHRIKKSTHRTNEQQVKVKYLESAFQTSLFPENKINANISQQQNHKIKKSTHRTNEQQVKVKYLESAFQTSLFKQLKVVCTRTNVFIWDKGN